MIVATLCNGTACMCLRATGVIALILMIQYLCEFYDGLCPRNHPEKEELDSADLNHDLILAHVILCYVYFSSGRPLAPKSLLGEHRTC
jgi:hypothetical protein